MIEKYTGFLDWEKCDPFQEKTRGSANPGGRETAGMVSGRRVIPGFGLYHVRIVTEAHRLDNPLFLKRNAPVHCDTLFILIGRGRYQRKIPGFRIKAYGIGSFLWFHTME